MFHSLTWELTWEWWGRVLPKLLSKRLTVNFFEAKRQRSTVNQRKYSAISIQLSAFSYQHSAISIQPEVRSQARSLCHKSPQVVWPTAKIFSPDFRFYFKHLK
ncbi:MAG: hypothetical protein F6J98_03325 [Moorea sp. SIO4G2]|nr:hypothetical protein [Moorena sp. SIO4G2]